MPAGGVDTEKLASFVHIFNSKQRTGSLQGIAIYQETMDIILDEQGDTVIYAVCRHTRRPSHRCDSHDHTTDALA